MSKDNRNDGKTERIVLAGMLPVIEDALIAIDELRAQIVAAAKNLRMKTAAD